MKSVLVRLEGPLQSWGTQGRFEIRDTDREPSKSGVIGLVGAALGMPRDDDATLGRLRSMRFAVRVDREGVVVRDYHTAGGGTFRSKPHRLWSPEEKKELTAVTQRFYLADASFLAALGAEEDAFVERIASALRNPVWPLFLGRRACVPSVPVYAGLVDASPDDAIRAAEFEDRDRGTPPARRVRLVLEATAEEGRPRQDVPESFRRYGRRHGLRYVRIEYMDRSIEEAT